jgi:hypothetical protein
MPNVGYGSNKKTKHLLPNGFYKFTVNHAKVMCLQDMILTNIFSTTGVWTRFPLIVMLLEHVWFVTDTYHSYTLHSDILVI